MEETKPKAKPKAKKVEVKRTVFVERGGSVVRVQRGTEFELMPDEIADFKKIGAI